MSAASHATTTPLDPALVRRDFPIFERAVGGGPLVFLDSAASAQKPRQVIETISEFYETSYANIHRGLYRLSTESTRRYEGAREKAARFLGAAEAREIIFVRNATEAINLVARAWGGENVGEGDEVVVTAMEHHANIVPWQMLCEAKGAKLRVVPMDERGELIDGAFEELLSDRTKIAALSHVSNALGTINPVAEMTRIAHERGIPVLLDGAQAVPHMAVDVRALDCDFYVFSGHKTFGPGVGVLYGKAALLESMPPFLGGGEMIETVTFEKLTFAPIPNKFEAGTPDIGGVVGLGAALDYLEGLGLDRVAAWEAELLDYATKAMTAIPAVRLVGTAREKAGVLSFVLDGVHPHDIGTIFDQEGVAIRAGHHCAQPVMDFFGVPATARASLSIYNTRDDVDALVAATRKAIDFFA